jgi:hypothetical protein
LNFRKAKPGPLGLDSLLGLYHREIYYEIQRVDIQIQLE